MTTKRNNKKDLIKVGEIISKCLKNPDDLTLHKKLKGEVLELTHKYPIK